jgi:hypothetical protein
MRNCLTSRDTSLRPVDVVAAIGFVSEYLIEDAVFAKVEALLAGVDASVDLEIIPFAVAPSQWPAITSPA